MRSGITARPLDYIWWLLASSVFALVSAVVTAMCIKHELRGLAGFLA